MYRAGILRMEHHQPAQASLPHSGVLIIDHMQKQTRRGIVGGPKPSQ
jgi:hypothetical protein